MAEEQERGDLEKWDQTDSPEIPDREETSESPAFLLQAKRVIMETNQNTQKVNMNVI